MMGREKKKKVASALGPDEEDENGRDWARHQAKPS